MMNMKNSYDHDGANKRIESESEPYAGNHSGGVNDERRKVPLPADREARRQRREFILPPRKRNGAK
jgi:hypothetical protein